MCSLFLRFTLVSIFLSPPLVEGAERFEIVCFLLLMLRIHLMRFFNTLDMLRLFLAFKLLNLYKAQIREEKVDASSRTVERLTPAPLACFQTETSSIEPDSRWEAGGESSEVR